MCMQNSFALPLAADDRRRAIELIETGEWVGIGQVSLHPDRNLDLIWGVDPYGVDCIAANSMDAGMEDFERAVEWAVRQNAPQPTTHPAEYSW